MQSNKQLFIKLRLISYIILFNTGSGHACRLREQAGAHVPRHQGQRRSQLGVQGRHAQQQRVHRRLVAVWIVIKREKGSKRENEKEDKSGKERWREIGVKAASNKVTQRAKY